MADVLTLRGHSVIDVESGANRSIGAEIEAVAIEPDRKSDDLPEAAGDVEERSGAVGVDGAGNGEQSAGQQEHVPDQPSERQVQNWPDQEEHALDGPEYDVGERDRPVSKLDHRLEANGDEDDPDGHRVHGPLSDRVPVLGAIDAGPWFTDHRHEAARDLWPCAVWLAAFMLWIVDGDIRQDYDRGDSAGTAMSPPRSDLRNAILFAFVVLTAGWLGRLLDQMTDEGDGATLGQLVWIISPIATASVLRFRTSNGWADAGLRPRFGGNGGWYAISVLFYPFILGLTAVVGFQLEEFVVDGGGSFPTGTFATVFLAGLVPVLFTSIAEEFGWRGYLLPRLAAAGLGRWTIHLVVGLIWGAWHIPYVEVLWDFTDESLSTLVPRLMIGTVVVAVVYGEIRLVTGSVWPAVVMHATGNAFVGALLADDVLDVASPTARVFSPGADGLVVIAASAVGVCAVVMAVRRRSDRRERPVPTDLGSVG